MRSAAVFSGVCESTTRSARFSVEMVPTSFATPRAAGEAIERALGALDGLEPHGDRFVSDGVLGDLKPALGGLVYGGIERVLVPEQNPLVKQPVRAAANARPLHRGA